MGAPAASTSFERLPPRAQTCMVPKPQQLDPGLVVVDATWGTIQPIAVAPGVETVGELELIEHLHAGRQLIDTRQSRFVEQGTIPGAVAIPHTEIAERLGECRDWVAAMPMGDRAPLISRTATKRTESANFSPVGRPVEIR